MTIFRLSSHLHHQWKQFYKATFSKWSLPHRQVLREMYGKACLACDGAVSTRR